MKYSRLSLAMIALLATQTATQAKEDKNAPKKSAPRTWRQAAYDNRYGIALGTATAGLTALGYVYGDDLMTWFNSLSPADQQKAQGVIEKSVEKDLAMIQEKQGNVADKIDAKKHSAAQQKAIAQEEQAIAQTQQQVAQKQTWLQSFWNMRASDPALIKIRAEIDANNAANPDDMSDDWGPNYERSSKEDEVHRANMAKKAQDNADFVRGKNAFNTLPGAFDASSSVQDVQNLGRGLRIQESLAPKKYKTSGDENNAAPITGGYVSDVLAGDFSRPKEAVASTGEYLSDLAHSAAQSTQDAYNAAVNYFSPTTPTEDQKAEDRSSQELVSTDSNEDPMRYSGGM